MAGTSVDLLIRGGFVLTMNADREVYERGAVAVDGSRIVDVGPDADLAERYAPRKTVSANSCVVMPGLVTTHTHFFQVLFRGLGDDRPLFEWLDQMIFPLAQHLTEEGAYWAGLLCQLELLRGGVTCVTDSHYVHIDPHCMDGLAKGVEESGIRAVLGRSCMEIGDYPDVFKEDANRAIRETTRVCEKWNGKGNGRITICPEVVLPMFCSDTMHLRLRELADSLKTGFHFHAAETAWEVQQMKRATGKGVIEYLDSLGVLKDDVLIAHAVWVSRRELEIIRDREVKIAHNPVSNQYVADGVAPIPAYLSNGVTVGIGVDGAASNNNQDMFGAMKLCALLHKVVNLDAEAITAYQVLEMATRDGAKALGLGDQIGSLERGKKADVIAVSMNRPHLAPNLNPISNLVYACSAQDVETVIVDGRIVVEQGAMATLAADRIMDQSTRVANQIVARANKGELARVKTVNYR